MKIRLLLLPVFLCTFSFSQNNIQKENYKNGSIKSERFFKHDTLKMIKNFYKNGQLKSQAYIESGIEEEYYKNGQLSYRKIKNDTTVVEEAYSKTGLLIIK